MAFPEDDPPGSPESYDFNGFLAAGDHFLDEDLSLLHEHLSSDNLLPDFCPESSDVAVTDGWQPERSAAVQHPTHGTLPIPQPSYSLSLTAVPWSNASASGRSFGETDELDDDANSPISEVAAPANQGGGEEMHLPSAGPSRY